MPDSADEERQSFTESLWDWDEKVLIQAYIVGSGGGDAETARSILQAKAMLASEEAARVAKESAEASREAARVAKESAEASRDVARMTRWLAVATGAMAVFTAAMAVATFVSLAD